MGKNLAAQSAAARAVFAEADEALGFPLSTLCFEGPGRRAQADGKHPACPAHRLHRRIPRARRARLGSRLRSRPQFGRVLRTGGGRQSAICRCGAPGAQARPIYARGGAGRSGSHGRPAAPARGRARCRAARRIPRRSSQRGESECARSGGHRRSRRRREPRHRTSQSRRRQARDPAPGERAFPLRLDETRAGAPGRRFERLQLF